jgi:flagellar protein FliO/FliZ
MIGLALQTTAPAVDTLSGGAFGLRASAAFLIVGVLLAAAVWALGRLNAKRRNTHGLVVESALPLGDKRSLVVVAVEGRRLLLGVSPGSVSLVSELAPTFANTLDRSLEATPQP